MAKRLPPPPYDPAPWDTGFRIHDAGWALIAIVAVVIIAFAYLVVSLA